MAGLRLRLLLVLGFALAACPWAQGRPNFSSSEIEGQYSAVFFCDLDGDRLQDAVLVDGLTISVYFQDAKQGFARKPWQKYRLEDRPSVIFPAKLDGPSESLLVMTSQGVSELIFTNRSGPPILRELFAQPTIIPEASDPTKRKGNSQVIYLPLSAESGADSPLMLVPVSDGVQVWQRGEAWKQKQFLEHTAKARLRPLLGDPGYVKSVDLNFSLADVNGDGRDDLILMRPAPGGFQTYALYLQQPGGRFTPEPVMTYTNKADGRSSLCWIDFNHDGKLDLVKGTFLDEPSFLPGIPSGKVLVGAYQADGQGRIPADPQQVFRKNDWSSALPVVDIDGDGYADLALAYVPINTREGFRKMLTAEQVDITLKFHCYRPGAGFSKEPDFQREVFIHLSRDFLTSFDHTLDFGQFINVNGDFNGDGKKDLLVRDHSDSVAAYFLLSREKGFSSDANFRFQCSEPIGAWEVADLNGDGVSDLIVKLPKRNVIRIFTSQGK